MVSAKNIFYLTMYLNNNNYNFPNSVVEAFAQNFASVYEDFNKFLFIFYYFSNIDLNSVIPINVWSTPLFFCSISLIEVFNVLSNLISKCCPGPDLIDRLFFQ